MAIGGLWFSKVGLMIRLVYVQYTRSIGKRLLDPKYKYAISKQKLAD